MQNYKIIEAWEDFMRGEEPNLDSLKEDILKSWKRCRDAEVPAAELDRANLVPPNEIDRFLIARDDPKFGGFEAICADLGITVSFYNRDATLERIAHLKGDYERDYDRSQGFVVDAREETLGTNSVALALLEGRPSQVIGSEHYNLVFRNCSCTAAPVLGPDGSIVGVLNYSRVDLNQTHETLNLIYSLARLYESLLGGRSLKGANRSPGRLEKANRASFTFEDIIHGDDKTRNLIAIARRVARTDASIIIYGESGVGKELFASAIHNDSPRSGGRFVAINCGAIPSNLIESELFGYERGAFTDAKREGKMGLLEYASGGTLFLDEIESMPLETQVRLLRALSTSSVKRIGGLSAIPIDLRIVSASKKDLFEEVIAGHFREDLYYRINVVDLKIPPLRERPGDIEPIVRRYLKQFSEKYGRAEPTICASFIAALENYDWPGNVRELKNIIERSVIFHESGILDASGPLADSRKLSVSAKPEDAQEILEILRGPGPILPRLEEAAIRRVLQEEKGNLSRAALRLGVSRQTLYQHNRAGTRQ